MKKPNVLFIYADQLRYDALACNGNTVVKTPNIDRLNGESVSFKNAYTSYPLCCPFRGSVLTGKYAHNHGLYVNHYAIPFNQEFLPQIMNEHGYHTGWIGKWHLNGGKKHDFVPKEERAGFTHFNGFTRGHSYEKSIYYCGDDKTPRRSSLYEAVYETFHLMDFVDESVALDKPFLGCISYGLPHPPFSAPDKYLTMYSPEEVPIRENVPKDGEEKAREFTAKYLGLVTMLDEEIGKVLDGLEKRGVLDDTMIIFVSDHGEMAGELGRYKKIVINDASMHVPFMIRYPKGFDVKTVYNMVDPSIDVFPTILDVCGVSIPQYAEGISLKAQCEGDKNAEVRDYVYFENMRQRFDYEHPMFISVAIRGIRTEKYCYQENEGVSTQLFDIENDPLEMNNLINDEKYSEIVKKLHKRVADLMEKTNDSLDREFDAPPKDHQTDGAALPWCENLFKTAVLDDTNCIVQ